MFRLPRATLADFVGKPAYSGLEGTWPRRTAQLLALTHPRVWRSIRGVLWRSLCRCGRRTFLEPRGQHESNTFCCFRDICFLSVCSCSTREGAVETRGYDSVARIERRRLRSLRRRCRRAAPFLDRRRER